MPKLTLYASHLLSNFEELKAHLRPETLMIPVVKANAYGSHAPRVAQQLSEAGAQYLAVAYTQEGIALRNAGIKLPIMVFYPQRTQFKALIDAQLEPALYRLEDLSFFAQLLSPQQGNYPIHLKFNTGLNRIGFHTDSVEQVLEIIAQLPLEIKSVYTHLCATEDKRPQAYMDRQLDTFTKLTDYISSQSSKIPFFHVLNTSGIFNYPEFQYDAVRSGIGLHGFANRPDWDAKLKAVAELSADICQILDVAKGDYVGYNFGWQAPRNSRIATLPLGHADGIGRYFGQGNAWVFIEDQKVPIVGNICMDLLMIDVTDIEVNVGNRVYFFGPQYSAAQWAKDGQTIAYELLTGLGPRIERHWTE